MLGQLGFNSIVSAKSTRIAHSSTSPGQVWRSGGEGSGTDIVKLSKKRRTCRFCPFLIAKLKLQHQAGIS